MTAKGKRKVRDYSKVLYKYSINDDEVLWKSTFKFPDEKLKEIEHILIKEVGCAEPNLIDKLERMVAIYERNLIGPNPPKPKKIVAMLTDISKKASELSSALHHLDSLPLSQTRFAVESQMELTGGENLSQIIIAVEKCQNIFSIAAELAKRELDVLPRKGERIRTADISLVFLLNAVLGRHSIYPTMYGKGAFCRILKLLMGSAGIHMENPVNVIRKIAEIDSEFKKRCGKRSR